MIALYVWCKHETRRLVLTCQIFLGTFYGRHSCCCNLKRTYLAHFVFGSKYLIQLSARALLLSILKKHTYGGTMGVFQPDYFKVQKPFCIL